MKNKTPTPEQIHRDLYVFSLKINDLIDVSSQGAAPHIMKIALLKKLADKAATDSRKHLGFVQYVKARLMIDKLFEYKK